MEKSLECIESAKQPSPMEKSNRMTVLRIAKGQRTWSYPTSLLLARSDPYNFSLHRQQKMKQKYLG